MTTTPREPCRLGLVGAGRWGRNYIRTLAGSPDVHLVAVASSNPDTSSLLPPGCRITTDPTTLADASDIHGVIIATPPATHVELAQLFLNAGKGVLVEKPVSMDPGSARQLLHAAQNRVCLVGHIHLYHPAYRELKRQLKDAGHIESINSSGGAMGPFRSDTPCLWDWGPHDLAMALELTCASPSRIRIETLASKETPLGLGQLYRFRLDFPGKTHVECTVGNIMPHKTRWLEVVTETKHFLLDDTAEEGKKLLFRDKDRFNPLAVADTRTPLECLVDEFRQALVSGRPHTRSLQLGVRVVELLMDLQQLANTPDMSAATKRSQDQHP